MKTPMQELIERLEKKYKEYISHKGNDEWYASVAYGIEISIRHAKLMVDVEKKQHANTWDDSRVEDKGDNYIGKQKSFNDYYEQTYGGNK